LMAVSGLVFYALAGDVIDPNVCILLWVIASAVLFHTVGPAKILTRMGRIEEAHKRRVAIEFNKAWMRNNKKFIKKNNKRIDREVKRLSRRHGDYWDGEWHTDYY